MMNTQWLDPMWDHIRQKYGIYLRVLEAIPADCFGSNPIAGMRTPTELVVHTSGSIVRDIAEGMASGSINRGEAGEDAVAAGLDSKEKALDFARDCWDRAARAIAEVDDAKLAGPIANPWGMALTGGFSMVILNDEFTHHRGQLYAYARACGGEPPFMWGFGDNAVGFQPKGS